MQVLLFVSQVIQRKLAHLPISLLEIHTLASIARDTRVELVTLHTTHLV